MIGRFISQIIGASVVWALKGFQGSLNDEMAGPEDKGFKKNRNFIITLIIMLFIYILFDEP